MILSPGEPPQIVETEAGLCFLLSVPNARHGVAHWAWLADSHIAEDPGAHVRDQFPTLHLERIAAEVCGAHPDATLVNGDIAWYEGARGDYEHFVISMAPIRKAMPLVLGVGNHDDRDHFLEIADIRGERVPQRITAIVDQAPFRLIVLDSQKHPEEVGGEIGLEQLTWLRGVLSEREAFTLLFVHHPGQSSSEGCVDFDELLAVAAEHKRVKAIVTGHDHEFGLSRANDIHLIALPAAGFTFRPEIPTGWVEATLSLGGADLRLHDANGDHNDHTFMWR